jgi:hypothetical protein
VEVAAMIQKKKAPETGKQDGSALAVHAHSDDGSFHVVGIGNLRVMLVEDGDAWFAQGLEIDYAIQGISVEDVKVRFEKGLYASLDEHIKVYGGIKGLLVPAPSEVWAEFLESPAIERYTQVSFHAQQLTLPGFFSGIDYFHKQKAA